MGKIDPNYHLKKGFSNDSKTRYMGRLKWYCQMCQRQCKDENGFKRHCNSEAHQQQLLLFAENPDYFIKEFSKEFKGGFLNLIKSRYSKGRVEANVVYQDYIRDRNHVHMNSTKWNTLADFVQYLGRKEYCLIDETSKGWFIEYIDRDPDTIKNREAAKIKEKMNLDYQERIEKTMQQQVERGIQAKESEVKNESVVKEDSVRNMDSKVSFTLPKMIPKSTFVVNQNTLAEVDEARVESLNSKIFKNQPARTSALEEIIKEELKNKTHADQGWVMTGIFVKIITQKLGDKYYKKKGVVKDVEDSYVAIVELLEDQSIIKLDQVFLETVLPGIGRDVLILQGHYRGCAAKLLSINESKFSATVQLIGEPFEGKVLQNISYEHISKV